MSAVESKMSGRTTRIFLASLASYNVASMSVWLQPAIVGDFVSNWGLDPSSAGLVASAEMVTIAITMLVAPRLVPAIRFLPTMMIGLVLAMAGTAGCLFVEQFAALIALRVVVALGFAALLLVPTMALAGLPRPQALYGRMYTISLICSSGLLALLPWIALTFGHRPGFKALLAYGVVLLPVMLLMPPEASSQSKNAQARAAMENAGKAMLLLAGGTAALSMSYAAIWAFFMIFARQSGLDAGQANTATAVCLLAAMAGSLLSPYFGRAVGKKLQIPASTILVAAGLLAVILAGNPVTFVLAGCTTLLSFYLLFPAVLGASAGLDPSGKGAALVNGSVVLLAAAGPYLGGLIMSGLGVGALVALVLASSGLSLLLFSLFARLANEPTYNVTPV